MDRKRSFHLVVCGLFIFLFGGCAMFRDKGEPVVVGAWTNPLGTLWIIRPDKTFDVDLNRDGKRDTWGTYKIDGNKITLQRTGGFPPRGCQGPGIYTFKREGDTLMLKVVTDRCNLRRKNVQLPWTLKM